MKNRILIFMIFIISFASAHDLFINHFEPTKSTLSNTTTTLHGDMQCETSKNSLHHSFHTDVIFYSEYIFGTIIPQAQIVYSNNTISYNLQSKQIKPPIA